MNTNHIYKWPWPNPNLQTLMREFARGITVHCSGLITFITKVVVFIHPNFCCRLKKKQKQKNLGGGGREGGKGETFL